ncbi:MAG: 6-carboxytetrahydropterin synthase [Chitinophagales bacterium]|nr:6-carboxytetrahydropterin synthase [Chitinophagales bacterium]
MRSSITRREIFNAAHRLFRPELSDEENIKIFGKCAYPNYHGHNYELHVTLTGEIDPYTGFVYDIADLKKIIKEEVTEPFDHRNLNLDTPDFQNLNPTVENICLVIYNKIRPRIDHKYDLKVKVYETIRNYSEYPA